jgi:predicted O-methyltransferase YrrM
LEIGTFTGYSALCLANGLTDDGQLHTIEIRKEEAVIAKDFFSRSAYHSKIILHPGSALDIIPVLNETWDLVFIDADKPAYIEYFNLVLPKLRKNGFIFADNIFFHGQVLEEEVKGKNAKAIKEFNEYIQKRSDIEKVILTLRDGLFLIRKL